MSLRTQRIAFGRHLKPSDAETIAMLNAVIREMGHDRALWLIGMTRAHFRQLEMGRELPRTEYFRRSVWWAYCQMCQPGRIRSRYDALTWARFSKMPAKPPAQTADDWSI